MRTKVEVTTKQKLMVTGDGFFSEIIKEGEDVVFLCVNTNNTEYVLKDAAEVKRLMHALQETLPYTENQVDDSQLSLY